ncbi:MAG TPA: hypothetical protein PKL56_02075 [Cyclobacteriaceae bacterium]|nr:hypothetical protein [Cyclobacteriaceae bacterium]HMV10693.1 hypothetical protein [Cyclobacteriaceae bacterium]HMV91546.1 hypothetical protein [Cyclobacteriaceae bacterium]HMX00068.1 hypothetical protein [Cyclobacteriaceae bacterium]HMX49070.1 hypothetical protein [Cyclobacteriaceae bacterium]
MSRFLRSRMSELRKVKTEPIWLSFTNMGYGYVNNDWLLIIRSLYMILLAIGLLGFQFRA